MKLVFKATLFIKYSAISFMKLNRSFIKVSRLLRSLIISFNRYLLFKNII